MPCLHIPYVDPFTAKPLVPWPEWPAFSRIRYLKEANDFGKLTKGKSLRYAQEPGSGVCAYFPTNADWSTILQDPEQPLIITEGELKAAKATKEGFPTIGLGGVYSYRSAPLGLTFIDELSKIDWVKRDVYVIFDSDYKRNEQVCAALNDLAEELRVRGAVPFVVSLPDVVDGGKTGLDDFLVLRDSRELASLITDRAQPLTLSKELWRLNNEVVYVRDPGLIVVRNSGQRISPRNFVDHAFSSRSVAEQVVDRDGHVSLKQVPAAKSWLNWPLRHEVHKMTYAPGQSKLVNEGEYDSAWNTWDGWGCNPVKSMPDLDIAPFNELLDHVFTDSEPEAREWFVSWLAYPLQNPGHKMFTSCMVHGIKQGTGKSLIGYTMAYIYGVNFAEIDEEDLRATHNEWAERKQFVLADDITGAMKRHDADRLKKLITQKSIRINPKYIPSYAVPDCINYYFTSNQPDAFFLEDNDRRFFVHEVTGPPLPQEFYREYQPWLKSGGCERIFRYLLDLDLGDFDPTAPALRTRAKELMTMDAKSDLGSWVHQLRIDPDHALLVGQIVAPGDLFTSKQLLAIYDPAGHTGTTANGLARELRRAGIQMIRYGIPLLTSEGQHRYYAVRNQARWASCNPDEARAHVEENLRKGKR